MLQLRENPTLKAAAKAATGRCKCCGDVEILTSRGVCFDCAAELNSLDASFQQDEVEPVLTMRDYK